MIEGLPLVAGAAIAVGGAVVGLVGWALRGEHRDARRIDPASRPRRRP
ncbi:MAG: hypothetical protein ACK40H_01895 [Sphingomonadaceae bacterium]